MSAATGGEGPGTGAPIGRARKVQKPWGYELIWAETDAYLGKILHVTAGEADPPSPAVGEGGVVAQPGLVVHQDPVGLVYLFELCLRRGGRG